MSLSLSLPHSTTNALQESGNRYERFVPNCGCQGILLGVAARCYPTSLPFPSLRTQTSTVVSFLPAVIDSNGAAVIHGMKRSADSEPAIEARQAGRQADRMENEGNRQHCWVRRLSLPSKLLLNTLPQSPNPKVRKSVAGGRSRRAALPACLPAYLKTRGYYFVYFPSL